MDNNITTWREKSKSCSFSYQRSQSSRAFLQQMNTFRQMGTFTDVRIVLGSLDHQPLLGHRLVLASASPFFRAVFAHRPDPPSVDLGDLHAESVESLIDYMYTGCIQISQDTAVDLLEAADFLQLREVVDSCALYLLQQVDVDSCLLLEHLGEAHMCRGLQEAARAFVLTHFTQVMKSEAFLQMEAEKVQQYLQDEALLVEEEGQLLEGLCCWAEQDLGVRSKDLASLLNLVNVAEVEFGIVDKVVKEHPLVKQCIYQGHVLSPHSLHSNTNGNIRRTKCLLVVPRQTIGSDKLCIWYMNPLKCQWQNLCELPFINRRGFSADVLKNQIYLCGGSAMNSDKDVVKDNWIFDLATKSWNEGPHLLRPRSGHGAAALNGHLYIVGGATPEMSHWTSSEYYDPVSRQWAFITMVTAMPGLLTPCVVALGDKAFVFGGKSVSCDGMAARTDDPSHMNDMANGTSVHNCSAFCIDSNTHSVMEAPKLEARASARDFIGVQGKHCCLSYGGFIIIKDEVPSKQKGLYAFCPVTGAMNLVASEAQRGKAIGVLNDTLYCVGGARRQGDGHSQVHCLRMTTRSENEAPDWELSTPVPVDMNEWSIHTVMLTTT